VNMLCYKVSHQYLFDYSKVMSQFSKLDVYGKSLMAKWRERILKSIGRTTSMLWMR
jgi:hypothetical protein